MLWVVVLFLVSVYFLDLAKELLNLRRLSAVLPATLQGHYDEAEYAKSQRYLRENTRLLLLRKTLSLFVVLAFIFYGGFNTVDQWARDFDWGEIQTGLLFGGALSGLSFLFGLPFHLYSVFSIETRFGFNRMGAKTFVQDQIKGIALSALLGGFAFSLLIGFYIWTRESAWLYAWGGIVLFQLLILFLAPAVILPLFNRFEPMPENQLKRAIEEYARRQNFKMQGLFTMDGSKRSTKSNAFFTGFGKFRRVVLFDTLIAQLSEQELVAVLAHEIGHFKKGHILKSLILSLFVLGAGLFFAFRLVEDQRLFEAFSVETPSVYVGLILASFLFIPFTRILSILGNVLSRKFEFEADAYSAATYRAPGSLASALKKLNRNHLSNLNPHPFKVLMDYSHPPLLQRTTALQRLERS